MNLTSFPRVPLLLLTACCAFCSVARADEKSPASPPIPRADPYTISIDFPGGPLSQLVTRLNAKQDNTLSIIQSAGLDPVLPAFSVREARMDAVIAALGRLLEPQGYFLHPTGPNLAVLSKAPQHRGQAFASLPLGDKLAGGDGWTVDEIIAAIQLGCEFAKANGEPSSLRFKYHPATKLLFAAGTEQEIDIAHRVFGSLPSKPSRIPSAPAPEKK